MANLGGFYQSTEPRIIGNPAVAAEVYDGTKKTTVVMVGDSEHVNMRDFILQVLSPDKWRGHGINGDLLYGNNYATVSRRIGATNWTLDANYHNSYIGDNGYWLGATTELKFTAPYVATADPGYNNRAIYSDQVFWAPGALNYGGNIKNGFNYMHNRAITATWNVVKNAQGVDGKFEVGLFTGDLATELTAPADFFAAANTIAKQELKIPALNLVNGTNSVNLNQCIFYKKSTTIPTGALIVITSCVLTFDDSPTGTVFINAAESGTTTPQIVASMTPLGWEAAKQAGVTHILLCRHVNNGYANGDITSVYNDVAKLAADARQYARPDMKLILVTFYDIAKDQGTADYLNTIERGWANYARADPLCCMLNVYAHAGPFRNLNNQGLFGGDLIHVNPTGAYRWLTDLDTLFREARTLAAPYALNFTAPTQAQLQAKINAGNSISYPFLTGWKLITKAADVPNDATIISDFQVALSAISRRGG